MPRPASGPAPRTRPPTNSPTRRARERPALAASASASDPPGRRCGADPARGRSLRRSAGLSPDAPGTGTISTTERITSTPRTPRSSASGVEDQPVLEHGRRERSSRRRGSRSRGPKPAARRAPLAGARARRGGSRRARGRDAVGSRRRGRRCSAWSAGATCTIVTASAAADDVGCGLATGSSESTRTWPVPAPWVSRIATSASRLG